MDAIFILRLPPRSTFLSHAIWLRPPGSEREAEKAEMRVGVRAIQCSQCVGRGYTSTHTHALIRTQILISPKTAHILLTELQLYTFSSYFNCVTFFVLSLSWTWKLIIQKRAPAALEEIFSTISLFSTYFIYFDIHFFVWYKMVGEIVCFAVNLCNFKLFVIRKCVREYKIKLV